MTRAIWMALATGTALAVIEPTAAAALAPLALLVGCAALGAWRLWRLHRVLCETDFAPAMAAMDRAELDDDCELATFTALQRADEYLEIAARLLDDAGCTPHLARRRRILHRRVDSFVFDTEGLGSLASAWAIEAACKDLAERAAMRWRRPAA